MQEHGILHETSWVLTPQQIGVAQWKNKHSLEVACALLFDMEVSKIFWAHPVSAACHLINRLPSPVLDGQVPYSLLFPSQSLFFFLLKSLVAPTLPMKFILSL